MLFFFRLIYCSEIYKCLHELYIKTVPDTSLHETSDLTYADEVLIVGASLMLKAVKNLNVISQVTPTSLR
jgi:hypothetical protein